MVVRHDYAVRAPQQPDGFLSGGLPQRSRQEKVEGPKGAYMSGTTLKQVDLREVVCYKCKKTGHIKKFCSSRIRAVVVVKVVVVKVLALVKVRNRPVASWRRRKNGIIGIWTT